MFLKNKFNRRDFMKQGSSSLFSAALGTTLGLSSSGWFPAFANAATKAATKTTKKKRSCILLWMNGGPSTIDLWDVKQGHENGGPVKEISSATPGLKYSEYLPQLAKWSNSLAILRGMSTKEGDHGRGTFIMHTGNTPSGNIDFPSIGSLISKELNTDDRTDLPAYISISPFRLFSQEAFNSGFLGPQFNPFFIGSTNNFFEDQSNADKLLRVDNISPPKELSADQRQNRLNLLREFEDSFAATHPGRITDTHKLVYE